MKKILVLLAGLAFLLTGCSMPSTAVDEVAVHRGGGLFESQSPKGCVPSGTKEVNSPGDSYFYYPANQSTYDFTGGKNSDSAPFTVVTKDNQTFEIPGSVKFSLNTKCEVLEKFHDNIGNRYAAYNTDSGQPRNDGWRKMLSLYIAPAVDGTLDRIAKQYNWRELRNDPSIKDKMNSEVNETVARLIQQQTPGNEEFFQNFSALIQQPVAPKELSIAAAAEESARAQASATQVKAEADAAAAEAAAKSQVKQKEAELKVAQIEADIKAAEIAAYGSIREYNNRMAIEKGLNPYQPTIVVGGGVAGK
jgi:hypothetical protein